MKRKDGSRSWFSRMMALLVPAGSKLLFEDGSLVCHGDKIPTRILLEIEDLLIKSGANEGRIHLKPDG